MITLSMNKFDIDKRITEARIKYEARLNHRIDDIKNMRRKNLQKKPYLAEEIYDKVNKQKYIVVAGTVTGIPFATLRAVVDHGSKVWIYEPLTNAFDTMDARSMHFYKRYAERTNKPMLFPQIIAKFELTNTHRFRIYLNKDNGDSVYATREGIELCRLERERGITKFCTFVSYNMLKDSQKKAWEMVQCKLDEADRIIDGDDTMLMKILKMQRWTNSSPDLTEEATEVYLKYKQEMD